MNFSPPAYAQRIGDQRFPRFVGRDGSGQYWTGNGWSENPSEAALYCSEAGFVADWSRYSGGEHARDTYTVQVVIITDRDAWTAEGLATHLAQFGGFHLERNREPRGVVIEVHWNDLHKTQ
jgi:hypothetical protein